jgi:hypothetical protein
MCDRASFAVKRSSGIGAIRHFRKSQPSLLTPRARSTSTGNGEFLLIYAPKDLGNGRSPVKARKAISPNDQISTATVYSSPKLKPSPSRRPNWISISGARKPRVPTRVRRAVTSFSARLLMPKSPIFTHQSGPLDLTRMFYKFSGLSGA